MTQAITQIPTDSKFVFAFRIHGEITSDDMSQMSERMNAAYDAHDQDLSLLLIFDDYRGSEFGAGLNVESIKAQFRALARLKKYVVVGAPETTASMIRTFGAFLPVDALTYDIEDEELAWREVGARVVASRETE